MARENSVTLEWYQDQIRSISPDFQVVQMTHGSIPGQPQFTILHLQTAGDPGVAEELLVKWRGDQALQVVFDIEAVSEEEMEADPGFSPYTLN
ncbi:MAG: hypothetical protein ACR2OW_06625 [Methyloligellaceae bacterium]